MLDDIINKYNNTVHRTNKMKPVKVSNDFDAKNPSMELHPNKKEPKFKIGDNIRISKIPRNCIFHFIHKMKNTVPGTYAISDLNGEEIPGSFYEKELQKTNQKEFTIEKVLKKKG